MLLVVVVGGIAWLVLVTPEGEDTREAIEWDMELVVGVPCPPVGCI